MDVPYATDIAGDIPGKTLLITAGMDGDEYAGIEAAYALIEKYQSGDFAGRLIIIPVVNVPGFFAGSSKNPRDGKFPKYVTHGNMFGSSSERMIHVLLNTYAITADAWLDLHGGATTERLVPFLWCFKTDDAAIDTLTKQFYSGATAETVVVEESRGGRSQWGAEHGLMYALLESGEKGERKQEDVERHVAWVETMMQVLDMKNAAAAEAAARQHFAHVAEITAPFSGVFYPDTWRDYVEKDERVGTLRSINRKNERELFSPVAGKTLWRKESFGVTSNETLMGIAY